ncbi:hypothetical protein EIB18_14775 [Caulobacter vibrioides]|nr:hypothetical protein CA608_14740 [Caulobacter vibrioides]AZH13843.1 hypothetical protein EIB18_14775 [Caulobacter vibrioides]PLR07678.1 hypothetical protein CVUC_19165 [Caulobacter vibrioides]
MTLLPLREKEGPVGRMAGGRMRARAGGAGRPLIRPLTRPPSPARGEGNLAWPPIRAKLAK